MPNETIELEGVGNRLSHSLIQKIRINHDDITNLWDVDIRCSIPRWEISEEKKQELQVALKKKPCHGKCSHKIDRASMDRIIALLQSNAIVKYEVRDITPEQMRQELKEKKE